MASVRHGTTTGYCRHKCRCGACTDAWRLYSAKWRARRAAQPIRDDLHGRIYTYSVLGCRCRLCWMARAAYDRQRRLRLAEATR